jgi:amidophosphoribosyltransferase
MGGLFGIASKENCSKTLFYGTDYHSHLGTENGGMAIWGETGFYNTIHSISQAQFKSRFVDDYKKMNGCIGIGVIDDDSPQPLIIRSKFGTYAIAATGIVTNKDILTKNLLAKGATFSEMTEGGVNTVELIAQLINAGKDIIDGIVKMQDAIAGSICALILTDEGIYAIRDKYGRFPLSIGRNIKGGGKTDGFVVATEASSFHNLGYEMLKFVEPGEIVLISVSGITRKKKGNSHKQVCAFLWIYTGYPSSVYENISVEVARERCGRAIARHDDVEADFVTGIPDSGVGHAIGYAMESGLHYRRPLVKYTPGYGRSYTPPSQDIRDLVATMKLSAVKDVIKGSRMIVCDDSIVRGTQLKNYTINKLWDNGAKEIHIRPACPPLMYPCIFGSSTRSISELASRRAIRKLEGKDIKKVDAYLNPQSRKYKKMVEWIRRDLNVTSLRYLNIEDIIDAIGLPEKDLCLYCWRGK